MRWASVIALWMLGCGPAPLPSGEIGDQPDRECGVLDQDCGAGEKCGQRHDLHELMDGELAAGPHALEPASCVPDGEASLEEACAVDAETGSDDCAAGLTCFTVDGERSRGVCLALCNPAVPDCGPVGLDDHVCRTGYIDAPGLCFRDCHPITDPCEAGRSCQYWHNYPERYDEICLPPGEQAYGEACGEARCAEGLDCISGTCTMPCETAHPEVCPSGYCRAHTGGDPADEGLGLCWVGDEEEQEDQR